MQEGPLPTALVLVVDDDESMRRLLFRELTPSFEVILASGCAEGMSALEKAGRTLAAIVTDLDLGSGRSGVAILEAARRRGLRCVRVLVSGDMHEELEARLAADDLADAAFAKPWPPHAVVACVSYMVGRPERLSQCG